MYTISNCSKIFENQCCSSMAIGTKSAFLKKVFTASKDGSARSWRLKDLADNPPELKFSGNLIEVLSVSNDGRKIAYSEEDNQITLLTIGDENGYESTTWKAHRGKLKALTFSSIPNELISVADDSMFKIWNIEGEPDLKEKYSLGFSPFDFASNLALSASAIN